MTKAEDRFAKSRSASALFRLRIITAGQTVLLGARLLNLGVVGF